MDSQSTGYQLTIDLIVVIVLLALLLFGIGYAWLVRMVRKHMPNHGYTAVFVVVGNLVVIVAFSLLVGLDLAALLFLCFGAAGLPMVVEYTDYYLRNQGKGGLDI
jgi:predicted membrane channel-forming protein YqfA (hemolysin III family)